MSKITLTPLVNLDNPNTAVSQINANFATIQSIVDTLLSRDGITPNTLLADLDMNGYKLYNLPAAEGATEPARYGDLSTYVTAASSSATAAAVSETNASTSETNAASSAASASTSETNASTSETNAASSAASASTSETNASSSATAASASETNSSASASDAATSASNAAASYDSFDDRYLGAKASDPATDNDGNTLLVGALFWNTTEDEMNVWDGVSWSAAYLPSADYLATGNNLDDVSSGVVSQDNIRSNGADIASAATVSLDNATGVLLDITGTTTTTAITLAQGKERIVRCAGAWPLTAGSSLIISNATSGTFTFQAGDLLHILGYASGVVRVNKLNGGAGIDDNATSSALSIAANGDVVLTGKLNLSRIAPILDMVETDNSNNYYRLVTDGGQFSIRYNGAYPGALHIDSSHNVSIGGASPAFRLDVNGSIGLTEKAAADSDVAGKGQLWIKNDTPNALMFTDDAGVDYQISGASASGAPSAVLEDQKASGVVGGSSVANTWTTRTLNTEVFDPDSLITLASNELTPAVDGWVEWSCPFYRTGYTTTRLYNVTDSVVAGEGTSAYTALSATETSTGGCAAIAGKTYRIEYHTSTAYTNIGLGVDCTVSGKSEVYSRLKFWRT